jgi:hypothetical protein
MVKIEGGKSAEWYASHCAICKRELKPQQPRVHGTATLTRDDITIPVQYCETCARSAQIQQACEGLKKGA